MNYIINFIGVFACIYITIMMLAMHLEKAFKISEKQLQIIAITTSSIIAFASCFFGGSQPPLDFYN